jgi:exopolysaccharide biosynthesis polyprenyl glycosylphosphotransferase
MFMFRWRYLALFLGDVLFFFLSLALALTLRRWRLPSPEFFVLHVRAFSFFIPVWVCIFYIIGFYDLRRINKLVNLISYTLLAFAANLAAATVFFYMFSWWFEITPKTNLLLTLLFLHVFAMLYRSVWVKFLVAKLLAQRVAFLGDNSLIEEIKRDLDRNPQLGFTVVPLPALAARDKTQGKFWLPRGNSGGELSSRVDLLVADAEEAERNPFQESVVLSAAVAERVPVITHLDFYEDIYGKIPPEHAAKPSWLFSNVLHKGISFYSVAKRGLDIIAALLGLLLLFPILAVTYLALKLHDGWNKPAFFIQKRVGYLGKKFIIWKFRTMVTGADKAGPLYQASADDARVTAIGRFLRLVRFDEIPQLWNVLKGDMSLIGPRPEWSKEVRILEGSVPHYHLRHFVKPGMTGWAQINFRATASARGSVEKLHYDLYYVKNMTLALDIGILLRTIRRIFQSDSSFSPEKRAV